MLYDDLFINNSLQEIDMINKGSAYFSYDNYYPYIDNGILPLPDAQANNQLMGASLYADEELFDHGDEKHQQTVAVQAKIVDEVVRSGRNVDLEPNPEPVTLGKRKIHGVPYSSFPKRYAFDSDEVDQQQGIHMTEVPLNDDERFLVPEPNKQQVTFASQPDVAHYVAENAISKIPAPQPVPALPEARSDNYFPFKSVPGGEHFDIRQAKMRFRKWHEDQLKVILREMQKPGGFQKKDYDRVENEINALACSGYSI